MEKEQIKKLLADTLKNNYISFDDFYKQAIETTLSNDELVTGRGARGLSSKGKAYTRIS